MYFIIFYSIWPSPPLSIEPEKLKPSSASMNFLRPSIAFIPNSRPFESKKNVMKNTLYTDALNKTRQLFNYPNLDTQYLIDYCLSHFDTFLKTSSEETYQTLIKVLTSANKSNEYHDFKDALSYAFEDVLNISPVTLKY